MLTKTTISIKLMLWNWPLSFAGILIAGGAIDQDRFILAGVFLCWFFGSSLWLIKHQKDTEVLKELDKIDRMLNK